MATQSALRGPWKFLFHPQTHPRASSLKTSARSSIELAISGRFEDSARQLRIDVGFR